MKLNLKFGAVFLVLAFFLQSCSSFLSKEQPQFVTVAGTKFKIGDKPYYFVGTNFWYGSYLGMEGAKGNRERLIKELDHLKELGVTNLRVLAISTVSPLNNSLKPALESTPGVFDEDLFDGLDFLLFEMKKRDMKGVLFLNNFWEWSGGMVTYNNWFGGGELIDPSKPGGSWDDFMNYSAGFYRNEKAMAHFRTSVEKVIRRYNKYSNVNYFDDPTIMSWQLANEPRPGNGARGETVVDAYEKWINETAEYIHSLDKNHLVTTGSEGLAGSLQSESYYKRAHQSRFIDYMTFHLWVKNWSWFDATHPETSYPEAEAKAVDYIQKHIGYATELGKPVVMEEFGMERDLGKFSTLTKTNYRDKYYRRVFELAYQNAASGGPLAGTNFWAWGGEARATNDEAIWHEGDPFTGDPPQEPQGVNSVFNSDLSTIKIIQEYAEKMNSLDKK